MFFSKKCELNKWFLSRGNSKIFHIRVRSASCFANHMLPEQNVRTSNRFNVVAVYVLKHVKIINCTFEMNKITALQAFNSTLYFGGHVNFSGNNGRLGGAMLLQGGSRFYLMPHTHVQIIYNVPTNPASNVHQPSKCKCYNCKHGSVRLSAYLLCNKNRGNLSGIEL